MPQLSVDGSSWDFSEREQGVIVQDSRGPISGVTHPAQ